MSVFTDYLSEKTAVLERVNFEREDLFDAVYGRSTTEAIQLGCLRGYPGMIQALLEKPFEYLELKDGKQPVCILTGGSVSLFSRKVFSKFIYDEHLVLLGLAEAYQRRTGD